MKTNFLIDSAANLIAVIYISYFVFIVGGMVAIVLGPRRGMDWVRNPCSGSFILWRYTWCLWKTSLAREEAIGSTEAASGVGGFLDYLLYHTISPLALDVMYWSFGVLVLALLWIVPPRCGVNRQYQMEAA